MEPMRFATAVGHLRRVVEALEQDAASARRLGGAPHVVAAHAFGELLEGPERLDQGEVALVVDRLARELPWGAEPPEIHAMWQLHRLDKVRIRWFCRPSDLPVANHRIVRPVRIWSLDGPDEDALEAIAAPDAVRLRPPEPDPEALAEQLEREAATSLAALDALVHGHRGGARTIAEELFDLAWGYTDLRRALAALRGMEPAGPVHPQSEHYWDEPGYRELQSAWRDGHAEAVVGLLAHRPLTEVAQLAGDALLSALAQCVEGAADAATHCTAVLRDRAWDGDDDLAAQLEAALGRAPSPDLREVRVDLDDLARTLDSSPAHAQAPTMRVNLATGEQWPVFDGYSDYEAMTGEPPPDDWHDPDAWLDVEPQGARDAYRDMERFVATVTDRLLADRLDRALQGRGAFRRFREVLADRPDEQSRWRVYSAERSRGRARAWLAARGHRPA